MLVHARHVLLALALLAPAIPALPPPAECDPGGAPDVEACADELGLPPQVLPPGCAPPATSGCLPPPCADGQLPSAASPCVPDPTDVPPMVLPPGCAPPATSGCVPPPCASGQLPSAAAPCIPQVDPTIPDPLPAPSLVDLLNGAGPSPILRINYPETNSFNRTPMTISFTTSLPADSQTRFEAAYVLAGGSTWTVLGSTTCPGNAGDVRTCRFSVPITVNGLASVRIGRADQTACRVNQCAVVNGVTFDIVRPTTVRDPAWSLPSQLQTGQHNLHFASEPGANVTIWYTVDGDSTRIRAGNVTAGPTGNATFLFTPSSQFGTYRLFPRAVDRAGNVEVEPSSPAATLYVVDSLDIDVESPSLYFKNGDTVALEICVRHGGDPVDDVLGDITLATYGGQPVTFTHQSGCTWTGSAGTVSGVEALAKVPLVVEASAGSLTGSFSGDVTLTPARLVAIEVDAASLDAWVPVGNEALVEVRARYNDTGEWAELVNVYATSGGDTFHQNTTGGGYASYFIANPTAASRTFTFAADYDYLSGAAVPVYPLNASQTLTWTRLVTRLHTTANTANHTDVGTPFVAVYRLSWEHSGDPAPSATVELWNDTETFFSGMANADGHASVELVNATVVSKLFAVNATYDLTPSVFFDETALRLRVNFTRVEVALATNSTLADRGSTFDFRVAATFAHDGAPIPSAAFVLRADDDAGRALDNVTLGADGVAYGHHTFFGTFDDNVSARLVGSILGVSAQEQPFAQITRIVSTEIVVSAVAVNDTDVHPSENVTFSFTGSYAHDGSPLTGGNFTFTPEGGGATHRCAYTAAAVSCSLNRTSVYSGRFTLTVETDDVVTITSLRGAPVLTPLVNWTRVDLTLGAPSDALVDVGSPVTVPATARFAHTGTPVVSGATLRATNATGATLGTCVTNSAGACSLVLTSAAVYAGTVAVAVDSSPQGVTQLASPASTGTLVWTRLVVSFTNDTGPFNRLKPASFHVNVTYAHNGADVQDALVSVGGFSTGAQSDFTDADGYAYVAGIESQVGTRTLTVYARHPAEGLNANVTASGSASGSLRWTAIGFRAYEFSPAPASFDGNGEPEWPVGTAVTVCTTVVEADTDTPLAGASVTIRGISRTSAADGEACINIAASSQVRNVTVTAHGVSANIGSKTITSSIDLRTVMHFVA